MDREELVQQILKQVLAKLTDMGEKADAACVRPDAVCPAAHKPGLLILTQEHGVDCHAKLGGSALGRSAMAHSARLWPITR